MYYTAKEIRLRNVDGYYAITLLYAYGGYGMDGGSYSRVGVVEVGKTTVLD